MGFRIVTVVLLAVALGACEQAQKGFDDGFNKEFEKSVTESCTRSATQGGASTEMATAYCACFVDQMKDLPVAERMKMTADSQKLKAVAELCKAKVAP